MPYIVDDRIIIDYPADEDQWVVTDTATGQVATTRDVTSILPIVAGFGGPDLTDYTTDRDSGDEDPHA